MQDLEPGDIHAIITRLFDASKNLDDDAFQLFVAALCKLSSEMVGMQAANRGLDADSDDSSASLLSPPMTPGGLNSTESLHRRRASGIQLARAPPVRLILISFFDPSILADLLRREEVITRSRRWDLYHASTCTDWYIEIPRSHGTPSLVIYYPSFAIHLLQGPSDYKRRMSSIISWSLLPGILLLTLIFKPKCN
jgi:hypothetical protein